MSALSVPKPTSRMRRLRRSSALRSLLQECSLSVNDLILPLFVEENLEKRHPIASMPGIYRETEESLERAVRQAWEAGIKAVLLFGVSNNKDAQGSDSFTKGGLLDRIIRRAKNACPDIVVIADLCFCEYTTHGHCGVLDQKGDVDNDATLDNLARQALIAAEAGADIVAPSGMMDGMVAAIRSALDSQNYTHVAILSYAAKFASGFYGPFRDAAGCSLEQAAQAGKGLKDRKTYQINPANGAEALREVALDKEEGADMVIVKPGLPYLDVIARVKEQFRLPVIAYQVSGEYAMLRAMEENGALDYESALKETLLCFKRAGADAVITYAALDLAKALKA